MHRLRSLVIASVLALGASAEAQEAASAEGTAPSGDVVVAVSTPSTTEEVAASTNADATPAVPRVASEDQLCAETANDRASASVVRVESGTAVGSGFVVMDATHVVTAFRTVRDGHGVRVVDHQGNPRNARVVATAPDDDLALLVLASPLAAAPLDLAEPEALHVGMRVVAIGHPYVRGRDRLALGLRGEGLFSQSLSEGVVSALGPRALSTLVP